MGNKKPKNNFYIVETKPGHYRTFDNWPACQKFVHGKPYAYAGGVTREAAMEKLVASKRKRSRPPDAGSAGKPPNTGTPKRTKGGRPSDYPTEGITSDAGTHGNPGPCECQVTDMDGVVLLHKKLGVHTNNYAELAGIGNMIQYALKHDETILWTDSQICLGWIASGNIGKTVHERDKIVRMVGKIQLLLNQNPRLELRKWHTKRWGEIPSDFGRK